MKKGPLKRRGKSQEEWLKIAHSEKKLDKEIPYPHPPSYKATL